VSSRPTRPRPPARRAAALVPLAAALGLLAARPSAAAPPAAEQPAPSQPAVPPSGLCLPAGVWAGPDGTPIAREAALSLLAGARVVLLGETHATEAHHRWQADVVAALAADGRPLVIALEQLPRTAQAALDDWVAGRLDEPAFLAASGWKANWGHDFGPYRPLFEQARKAGLPMRAVNIERGFVRAVGQKGYARAAAEAGRPPVGRPAPPPEPYVAMLRGAFAMHGRPPSDEALARFVEAQASWDRAMAEGIAEALAARPEARVVGIMGWGHVVGGHGVAHQLRALGHRRIASAIPVRTEPPCPVPTGAADLFFGAG